MCFFNSESKVFPNISRRKNDCCYSDNWQEISDKNRIAVLAQEGVEGLSELCYNNSNICNEEFDKYMRISSNQIIEKNVKY